MNDGFKCFPGINTPIRLIDGDISCLSSDYVSCIINTECDSELRAYSIIPVRELKCNSKNPNIYDNLGTKRTKWCVDGIKFLLKDNEFYSCDINKQIYLFYNKKLYPVEKDLFIYLNYPSVNFINCNLIKNSNFGQVLNKNNYKSILKENFTNNLESTNSNNSNNLNKLKLIFFCLIIFIVSFIFFINY